MIYISWVNDQIAVSGAFSDKDIPYLVNTYVSAIVDVRSEHCDNERLIRDAGIEFLHMRVDDGYTLTLGQLEEIFNFVEPILDKGKKVLIHCQNGCGRSPLVAAAIIAKRGMDIAAAVRLLEDKHPWTSFTLRQEKFIYTELAEFLKHKQQE